MFLLLPVKADKRSQHTCSSGLSGAGHVEVGKPWVERELDDDF